MEISCLIFTGRRPKGGMGGSIPLVLLLSAWVWLFSCWPAIAGGETPAAMPPLLVGGELRGEIRPCGCSQEGQFGGLPRRLTYLSQVYADADSVPILLDLGNNFPPPSPQGDLKIDLVQTLLKNFPPVAILPGPNELALGPGRLDRKLPYLVSNDALGKVFLPHAHAERNGVSVGVFGYLSPLEIYQKSQTRFRLEAVSPTLLARWKGVITRKGFQQSVLLFRGKDEELEALHRSGLFGAIVTGNPFSDELNQVVERQVAGIHFPQVPTKGQGFLSLKVGEPDQPRNPRDRVIWLSDRFPDHPAAAEPFLAYEEKVKALFFAGMKEMKRRQATTEFSGANTCATCHVVQDKIWRPTRHAGALKTLEKVGKHYDPECLACHVVGLNQGGFVSTQSTPEMGGVQCENCHGPGKGHLANPTAKPAPFHPPGTDAKATRPVEATCRTCHVGSHSPTFDFKVYWPKVKH